MVHIRFKPLKCPQCPKLFSAEKQLRRHLAERHEIADSLALVTTEVKKVNEALKAEFGVSSLAMIFSPSSTPSAGRLVTPEHMTIGFDPLKVVDSYDNDQEMNEGQNSGIPFALFPCI